MIVFGVRQSFWQGSGLIRDREFDLEQEQRPGAGRDAATAGARGAGP
jgi:hypothetical protein